MNDKINLNCTCPKTRCKYHGHCAECRKMHNGKPFCTAKGLKKSIAEFLFSKSNAN